MGFHLTGRDVAVSVGHLADLTDKPETLKLIEEASTSCVKWGHVLRELMKQDSIKTLYVKKFEESMLFEIFKDIERDLRAGKAVIASIKLPTGRILQHAFCIESTDGLNARILHSWQGVHSIRAEKMMAIEKMIQLLKELSTFDWDIQRKYVQNVFHQLFGADNAKNLSQATEIVVRRRVSFETMISGRPERPIFESRVQLSGLLDEISYRTAPSGTAVGGALGFVFGVGGVLISGERDPKEEGLAGTKSALGGAAGGGAGAAAAKLLTPTLSRIGASVVRANVLSGVAFFSVFAIWDVVEWRMHKITEVQLRQRMAEGLARTAGGIGGGVAGGVGLGLWLGPTGVVLGGLIGGLAGAIGGSYAGKAIDEAIWDKSEDSIMNSYEFFGWHDVQRNTRPVKSAEQMQEAYDNQLKSKPSNMEEKDWDTICRANLMVLLPAMFPVFTKVMTIADYLHKNRSDGVSAIAQMMYQSISEE